MPSPTATAAGAASPVGIRTVTYVLADPSKSFTLPVTRTDAHGNVVSEGGAGGTNRWLSVGNGSFLGEGPEARYQLGPRLPP